MAFKIFGFGKSKKIDYSSYSTDELNKSYQKASPEEKNRIDKEARRRIARDYPAMGSGQQL